MTRRAKTKPLLRRPGNAGVETAGGFERSRVPSLDGFRGVGIVIVMLVHAFESPGLPFPDGLMNHAYFIGLLAVGIFFCVSGYLISRILLEERSARGNISLRNFYLRRALRIFPAYYTYVAVLIALGAFGVLNIPWQQSVQAATYTRDFFVGPALAFGVTWSLAIEEQFYLVWPPILAAVSNRRLMKGLLVLFCLAPAIRYGVYRWLAHVEAEQLDLIWRLPTGVMDYLIAGCFLALVEKEFPGRNVLRLGRGWDGAFVATVLLVAAYQLPGAYDNTFAVGAWILPSVGALWAATMVRRYVDRPRLPVGRLLNSTVVVRLGHLSYSLYLWHILFVNPYGHSLVNRFPISVLIAFGVAWLSREYIEKPFLRRKTRYQAASRADHSSTTLSWKGTTPSNAPS